MPRNRMENKKNGTAERKTDMTMASWNVKALKPGKMQEIIQEIVKSGAQIATIQEIRWHGTGRIDTKDATIFYSGTQQRTSQYGIGFIITKESRGSVLKYTPVNKRISALRVKGRTKNITTITVHAPTEDKDANEKEEFYDTLEETLDETPKYDVTLIIGDFNAQIGNQVSNKGVSGIYTIHEESNNNRDLLCQLAIRRNLMIKSTLFPHKRIHLGTWKCPNVNTINQIDHVLVNRRHTSSIIDVRSCREPNCDSNHFLLRTKLREKKEHN